MLETEGWSPGCDVSALEYQAAPISPLYLAYICPISPLYLAYISALEYQAALRTGRMNAVPMPSYGYEKSNAATERLARRAAAEASAKRALRGPQAASPPPTAEPAPSPAAKPAAKPKRHRLRHSDETASAAPKPPRPVAPDPAVPAAASKRGGVDAWLAMPGDGSEASSERDLVFVVDKSR